MPVMNKQRELRSDGTIAETLGKERLHALGLDLTIGGKITARQAIMLYKVEEELPFMSDVAKAEDIELQEMTEHSEKHQESHCSTQGLQGFAYA